MIIEGTTEKISQFIMPINPIYNFKTEKYWMELFDELGLEVVTMNKRIPLYPGVFNMIFGRQLHFIAVLKKKNS